jgi:hypothetical protein
MLLHQLESGAPRTDRKYLESQILERFYEHFPNLDTVFRNNDLLRHKQSVHYRQNLMNEKKQRELHEMANLLMETWIILDRLTEELKESPQFKSWHENVEQALKMVKESSERLKNVMSP